MTYYAITTREIKPSSERVREYYIVAPNIATAISHALRAATVFPIIVKAEAIAL
ncbi:hypothetical protein ACRDNQ_04090 [Palleronia sp. KMU-117]|uniref:hypothetical protein n=1 Tax=Palleronia sp. KMU-117 TaxID=3434108 RepID=UPI003D736C57